MGVEWFDEHLETFVKPYLGNIPKIDLTQWPAKEWVNPIMAYTDILFQCWDEIKKQSQGKVILLPGRDVYLFEILARIEDVPTICKVEFSSSVVQHISKEDKEKFKDCFVVDTGFKGTVPKAIGAPHWKLLRYAPGNSAPSPKEYKEKQLFPDLDHPSISFSWTLEAVSKYWERAEWNENTHSVVQHITNPVGFSYATIVHMVVVERFFKDVLKQKSTLTKLFKNGER